MPEKKFYKYLVLKNEDIKKYLDPTMQGQLNLMLNIVERARMEEGKESHEYLVCGTHEPYCQEVVEVFLKHGVVVFTEG